MRRGDLPAQGEHQTHSCHRWDFQRHRNSQRKEDFKKPKNQMTDFCSLQRAGTCDTNKGSWAGWWRGRGGMRALTHWADPHRLQVSPLQVSPLQVSPSNFRLQASCNVGHCNFNVFIQHSPLNYIPYFNCNDCNCLNSTDSENTEVLPLTAVLVLPRGSGP